MLRDSVKTDCQSCQFLDKEAKECTKRMNVIEHRDRLFTLGFCRQYAREGKPDVKVPFSFDLFVIFDEAVSTYDDLVKSIQTDQHFYSKYCKAIHILDISIDRTDNVAIQFFKDHRHKYEMQLHTFLPLETKQRIGQTDELEDVTIYPDPHMAIFDVSRKLKNSCNYFLVLPAGKRLTQKQHMDLDILGVKNKVLHWNFPTIIDGDEQILMLYTGLYLKQVFLKFGKRTEPYVYTLKDHEIATGMQLSWLVSSSTIE